jgi:hypothetical protein
MLRNSSAVTNYFGYWPEFCDARVESISFSRPGTVELTLFYIDTEQNKSSYVTFRFHGVADLELSELRNDNVVDELVIEPGQTMTVQIVSACGLSGRFTCLDAEVRDVKNT